MTRIILTALALLVALVAAMWVIGSMLPVAHVASGSQAFPRPVEDVFRLVSSIEAYPQWWSEVSSIEVLARDPNGNLTFRQHGSGGPVVMQVVELRPPTRFVTRIADSDQPFGGTWTFELEPQDEGTRLTITERGEVYNPLFRFMARFVFGHSGTIESFLQAATTALAAR